MLNWLLTAGGLLLFGGTVLLLTYEAIAVMTTYVFQWPIPIPTISSKVIPWIHSNRLLSSIYTGILLGIVVFLILHWRIGQ